MPHIVRYLLLICILSFLFIFTTMRLVLFWWSPGFFVSLNKAPRYNRAMAKKCNEKKTSNYNNRYRKSCEWTLHNLTTLTQWQLSLSFAGPITTPRSFIIAFAGSWRTFAQSERTETGQTASGSAVLTCDTVMCTRLTLSCVRIEVVTFWTNTLTSRER